MGRTPAAYGARLSLRHKTRKQPFSMQLHTLALLQLSALIAVLAKALGLYWHDAVSDYRPLGGDRFRPVADTSNVCSLTVAKVSKRTECGR